MAQKSFNIASKIRKLMTLAERGEGNEAEVAAAQAQRLMREHAISMASLKETEILEQDPLVQLAFEVGTATWRIRLAWALAEHCQVSVLRSSRWTEDHPITKEDLGSYKRRVFAWGYGHSSDLEVWEYLYQVALRQIESEARKYASNLEESRLISGRFWVDDDLLSKREAMNRFRYGAVSGLGQKLREQRYASRVKATETSDETALEAIDSRQKRATDFMRDLNPRVGTYSGGVASSSAGLSAGRTLSINKGVAAGRNRKMLGAK